MYIYIVYPSIPHYKINLYSVFTDKDTAKCQYIKFQCLFTVCKMHSTYNHTECGFIIQYNWSLLSIHTQGINIRYMYLCMQSHSTLKGSLSPFDWDNDLGSILLWSKPQLFQYCYCKRKCTAYHWLMT